MQSVCNKLVFKYVSVYPSILYTTLYPRPCTLLYTPVHCTTLQEHTLILCTVVHPSTMYTAATCLHLYAQYTPILAPCTMYILLQPVHLSILYTPVYISQHLVHTSQHPCAPQINPAFFSPHHSVHCTLTYISARCTEHVHCTPPRPVSPCTAYSATTV